METCIYTCCVWNLDIDIDNIYGHSYWCHVNICNNAMLGQKFWHFTLDLLSCPKFCILAFRTKTFGIQTCDMFSSNPWCVKFILSSCEAQIVFKWYPDLRHVKFRPSMWNSDLWNRKFRPLSCEVQNFEMWSSDFVHVKFRPLKCGVQTLVMWHSEFCYMKFRPLTCEVQTFVMWSSDLWHGKFLPLSCEVQTFTCEVHTFVIGSSDFGHVSGTWAVGMGGVSGRLERIHSADDGAVAVKSWVFPGLPEYVPESWGWQKQNSLHLV